MRGDSKWVNYNGKVAMYLYIRSYMYRMIRIFNPGHVPVKYVGQYIYCLCF